MKKAIVIGSGLAGLFSAYILKNKGYDVSIIDNSKFIGGLISSPKIGEYFFDHGAHILQETKNKKINAIFFNDKKKFYSYKFLPQEHLVNNKWYKNSSYLNVMLYKNKLYKKIFEEILNQKKKKIFFKNERDRCISFYGKTFTNKILEPILKNFTGKKLSLLPINTKEKFNLSRIIIGKKQVTNKLKKDEFLNKILAFNSYKEGVTGRRNYYPKSKGMNYIIDLLLKKNNFNFFLNEKIKSIKIKKNLINQINTSKNKFKANIYVWTGNLDYLNQIIIGKPKTKSKNFNIYWSFFHYLTKKKLRNKSFYSYIYDIKSPIYRITNYDNFQKNKFKTKKFRITIENISPKQNDNIKLSKQIVNYLKKQNILNKSNKIELVKSYSVPINIKNGKSKKNNKTLSLKNLYVLGQAANKFKKEDILNDVYNTLSTL